MPKAIHILYLSINKPNKSRKGFHMSAQNTRGINTKLLLYPRVVNSDYDFVGLVET